MNLKEKLQKKHAKLLVKQGRLWDSLYSDLGIKYTDGEQAETQQPELHAEYKKATANLDAFEQELKTYPEFFDELIIWMVDIIGQSDRADNGRDIFESFIKAYNMPDAVAKNDNIAALVSEYLTQKGFEITDMGGGGGAWHIGVPCTESESRKMIGLMRNDFDEFFKEGVLVMKRWDWGARWKDLTSWQDAERFLRS